MTQRLRHGLILGVCASVVVISVARDARAWGPRGHRLAARVAESRLSPAAKAEIKAILHDGDTIVSESSWADDAAHRDFPESASWHFVNVPLSAAHYEAQFCRGGGCVVEKIKHYRKVLADRRAPKAERAHERSCFSCISSRTCISRCTSATITTTVAAACKCALMDSRQTCTRYGTRKSSRNTVATSARWTDDVERLITPERAKEWSQGDVESWADESLQEAKKAYRFPPGSDRNAESGVRLGGDYAEAALPVIRLRLAQAGVRLANELNAALGEGGNR